MINASTELFSRKALKEAEINTEIKALTLSVKDYCVKTGADLSHTIISNFCAMSDVNLTELKSKSRKREIVKTRQRLFWGLRFMTAMSLNEIGDLFNRDHATVLHGSRKVMDELSDKVYGLDETKSFMSEIILNIKHELDYRSYSQDDVSEMLYRKALAIVNRYLTQKKMYG